MTQRQPYTLMMDPGLHGQLQGWQIRKTGTWKKGDFADLVETAVAAMISEEPSKKQGGKK